MKKFALLIAVFFFSVLLLPAQVKVVAPINPNAPTDNYPTHIDSLGHGGFMTVKNTTIRNSISTLRRKEGMLVYVIQTDSLYQLKGGVTNTNWTAFKLGSANGIIWFGALAAAPSSPQLNWGYYNSTDKKSYLYCADNTNVVGWQVIATNNSSGQTVFTDSVFMQGGNPEGPESLVSSTLINTKLETREYLLDFQYENRPRFRRYVLGLDNKGMIALVRPHIQSFMFFGEWYAPIGGFTIPANGQNYFDVPLDILKPQLGSQEEMPAEWGGLNYSPPLVTPVTTSYTEPYNPASPPPATAFGLPSGLIIAWSVTMSGYSSEIIRSARLWVRVCLRNLTGSPITLPYLYRFNASVISVDEGGGAIYLSDLPLGG